MYRPALISACVLLAACSTTPDVDIVRGGERVDQSGVSFVLPAGEAWAVITRSADQAAFGAMGLPRTETVIVSTAAYDIQPPPTRADFLRAVQAGRRNQMDTGRFQVISNSEELVPDRKEICVRYQSASRDFGTDARRGGAFNVLETVGMHCVHPDKPGIGVQVELSRKAPPDSAMPGFGQAGQALLRSVSFREF